MTKWYGAHLLAIVGVYVIARQTAAVSHGRIRNAVAQCQDVCATCNQCLYHCQLECVGCHFCIAHFTPQSMARATSCLDVDSSEQVTMEPCDATNPKQNWTYVNATQQVRNVAGCLDASEDAAVVTECDSDKTSQRWTFDDELSRLTSSNGKRCLDSTREFEEMGSVKVAVSDCGASTANQKWLLEPLWSMDPVGEGQQLTDAQWEEVKRAYRPPPVSGDYSAMDPDGDGYINRTAAEMIYAKQGDSIGGRGCTPYELLPYQENANRYAAAREEVKLTPAKSYEKSVGPIKKIYYINLEWSHERRELMESRLESLGIPYERFPAVDAVDVKAGKYDEDLNRSGVAPYIAGEWGTIACALSHLHAYKKIYEEDPDGEGIYLVLEDDALFVDDWQDRLATLLKEAPNDWNAMLAAWWNNMRCPDVVNEHFALALEPQITWMTHVPAKQPYQWWYAGAAIVVVSPKRLPPLLERLNNSPINHMDLMLLSFGATRTYCPVHRLGKPDANGMKSDREAADKKAKDPDKGSKEQGSREQLRASSRALEPTAEPSEKFDSGLAARGPAPSSEAKLPPSPPDHETIQISDAEGRPAGSERAAQAMIPTAGIVSVGLLITAVVTGGVCWGCRRSGTARGSISYGPVDGELEQPVVE